MIHAFSVPGGPGVRVDTFAHAECTVSPYYDSMIAKIIVHGRDRQEAIARMRRTLEMTVIEGIKTSVPLHLKILADPDFQAGRLSTGFMDRFMPEARRRREPGGDARESRPNPCPPLHAILDVDVAARARLGAAAISHAPSRRRRARSCSSAPSICRQGRVPRAVRRASCEPREPYGASSSSTTAPTSRGWPGRPACTSGRTICRRLTARALLGPGGHRRLSTHTVAQIDAAAARAGHRTSRSGRSSARDEGHGLRAGRARPGRQRRRGWPGRSSGRGDRRHHARDRAVCSGGRRDIAWRSSAICWRTVIHRARVAAYLQRLAQHRV